MKYLLTKDARLTIRIIFYFLLDLYPGILLAQKGSYVAPIPPPKIYAPYTPPRASSAEAKYNYQNSHYPSTPPSGSVIKPVYNNSSSTTTSKSRNDIEPTTDKARPDRGIYDYMGNEDENAIRIVRLKDREGYVKWGFMNKDGKVSWLIYNAVSYIGNGLYEVMSGNQWGFIDKNAVLVIPCQFDYIQPGGFNSEGLAAVRKYGKDFFINKKGEPTTPSNQKYWFRSVMGKYMEGLACVSLKDKEGVDRYGFIDESGFRKIPLIYDEAIGFSNGLASVKLNAKWGCIDKTGKVIIPILYSKPLDFKNGFSCVSMITPMKSKEQYGMIDKNGKVVVEIIYDFLRNYSKEGLASVSLGNKWGYIDTTGKLAIPIIYEYAMDFTEGAASVKQNGKWGKIDKSGNIIAAIVYDEINYISEGLMAVRLDGQCGFIDKNGKVVIPLIYDSVKRFIDGKVVVKFNGKWGLIDTMAKVIVPFKYEGANTFSEGLAAVKIKGKLGYVNSKGKLTITAKYDWADNFSNGIAAVMLNHKYGFINNEGKEIIPLIYDYVFGFKDEKVSAKLFYGPLIFFDKTGKQVGQSDQ